MREPAVLFTIIVPTYNHGHLLPLALTSIARQSLRNYEVFIIGDGPSSEVEKIAQDFCSDDKRFHWFRFPKSPRTGELYRHKLITSQAQGRYIAYLSDDDIWHSQHLETMKDALSTHDFVAAQYISFFDRKNMRVKIHSISNPSDRDTLKRGENFLPLSTVAHTKKRYLELPFGWRTTPQGTPTDLYMWQQWVHEEDVSFFDAQTLSVLNFPAPPRKNWSDADRKAELMYWLKEISEPNAWLTLHKKMVTYLLQQISEYKTEPERERLKRYKAEDALNKLKDAKLIRLYIKLKKLFTGTEF